MPITLSNKTFGHSTSAGYKHIPSGGSSNQYLKYSSSGTAVWAAAPVTGVKGNTESSYRTGNINLTPANIGALPITTNTQGITNLNNCKTTGIYTAYYNYASNWPSSGLWYGTLYVVAYDTYRISQMLISNKDTDDVRIHCRMSKHLDSGSLGWGPWKQVTLS